MEYRADSRFAPSQWETSLQSNAISHSLGANLESALETCTWFCCAFPFLRLCCQFIKDSHDIFTIYIYCILHAKWVAGNQYSQLFINEEHHCANLCMQEQSMNMTSQCQYHTSAWCHTLNWGDVTLPSQKIPCLAKMVKWAIDDCFSGFVCLFRAWNSM